MISQYGNTYYGLDDEKNDVAGVAVNGRAYVAMDTSKLYFFDGENAEWKEWGSSSSDDGGGASV